MKCIVEGCDKERNKYCNRHGKELNADQAPAAPAQATPVDDLLRPRSTRMSLDLPAKLHEQLAFHSIDEAQVIYFLGLLVAGELEHPPYKGDAARVK